jgi:hypothetical protein
MQSAICPAQLSARKGQIIDNEPPKTLIMAPIDAPHDSMESQDQIRPLPTPSILLRQMVNTMHRPLESELPSLDDGKESHTDEGGGWWKDKM